MSAPIDVLAVIDAERPLMAAASALTGVDTLAAHDAMRETVAELIAADKEYDAAKAHRIEADNRITSGDRSDDAFRRQASARHAYDRAVDRRAKALANIGGTP